MSHTYHYANLVILAKGALNFLRSLKQNPEEQVIVTTITGKSFTTSDGHPVRFNAPQSRNDDCALEQEEVGVVDEACCENGACTGPLTPSCSGPGGIAFDGYRYRALPSAFSQEESSCEASGACTSICEDRFDAMFTNLQNRLESAISPVCEADREGV